MRKSDQKKGVPYYDMLVTSAHSTLTLLNPVLMHTQVGNLTFHRADFINTLSEQLDLETTTAHFSKRLVSYTPPPKSSPSDPITLNFKDGTTSTCDVLIAADGIHSATRHTMLELAAVDAEADGSEEGKKAAETLRGMVDPVWSGSVAYRAIVPREKLEKINPNHSAMFTAQNVSSTIVSHN